MPALQPSPERLPFLLLAARFSPLRVMTFRVGRLSQPALLGT